MDQCQARLLGCCVSERKLAVTRTFAAGVLPLLHHSRFGSTAIMPSPTSAASCADLSPLMPITMGIGSAVGRRCVRCRRENTRPHKSRSRRATAGERSRRLRAASHVAGNGRPALADDVLVETFARSDRKRKPTLAHHADRGCRLGDDCRMVAHDRQVSPVDIPIFCVVSAMAPRTLQANGECPCDSSHG